jgi:hypothetical protein
LNVVTAFTSVDRVRAMAHMHMKQRTAHSTMPTSRTLRARASIASAFTFSPWRFFFRTLDRTFHRLACSLVSVGTWIRGHFMRFTTHSLVRSERFAGLTLWPDHALTNPAFAPWLRSCALVDRAAELEHWADSTS